MRYEEFKQELKERVEQKVENGIEVYFTTMEKNNQKRKEVITFREEGINTMPLIHLQDLYEKYCQEEDMNQIVEFILEVLQTKTVLDERDILGNWETIRERICMKLINYEWNKEMLKHTPHHKILDLAAIFQIGLYQDEERKATVTVKNEFLNVWGITVDELVETAMENLKQESYEIRSMKEVLSEILGMGMEDAEAEEDVEGDVMYVLSNVVRCNGAVGIMREDLLKEFAEKIQGSFYILPSSTHELIFLPEADGIEKEDLKRMVKEVNATQVEVEERLADNVYYYNRTTGTVEM